MKKNIKIQKKLVLDFKNDSAVCLIMLNTKNIAAAFEKGLIKIFDNLFNIKLSIKENNSIFHIIQIKDGSIISSSFNIKIIKLFNNDTKYLVTQIINDNENLIFKTIELSTSHLVSVSEDGVMRFYMKDKDSNEYFLFKENSKVFNHGTISNVFEIPNKKFVVSSGRRINFNLKLFDAQTCDYIKTLENFTVITYLFARDIYLLLDENFLAVGTYSSISVIDLRKEKKIQFYFCKKGYNSYTYVLTKINSNYVLQGDDTGNIELLKINDDFTLKSEYIIQNAHGDDCISSIISIDKNNFLSCGKDGKIIAWEIL